MAKDVKFVTLKLPSGEQIDFGIVMATMVLYLTLIRSIIWCQVKAESEVDGWEEDKNKAQLQMEPG